MPVSLNLSEFPWRRLLSMLRLRLPNACFEHVPSIADLHLQELDIKGNRLTSLEGLPLGLRILHVSDNRLLQDGLFLPFPHLEELDASLNNINIFEEDGFILCFPSLKKLNLSKNMLRKTGFLRHSLLDELNVSQNRIVTLSGLPQTLRILLAERNDLTIIQSKAPPLLEILDVQYNLLRFAGLPLNWSPCLRELHLDHNLIEKFPRKLPDSLEILTLNHNNLTEIPSVLPASLRILSIQSNRLRSFPPFYRKRFTICLLDDNCLVDVPNQNIASVFSAESNWDMEDYNDAQRILKKCFKRYVMTLRLRQYTRTQAVRDELFTVSMMPERWEQIDALDSAWLRTLPSRSHTHPH